MPAFGLDLRKHALTPQEWGNGAFTDFWIFGTVNGMLTAGNAHELSDYGWTTTALSLTAGTGADFGDSADVGTPGGINFDAASDLLESPEMFGDYAHMRMAQSLLGYLPTKLIIECYAAITGTTNETATGFGFAEAGGSPIVATGAMAMIIKDGTNFVCRSGADSDVGALIDSNWHVFKIVVTAGATADAIEWFIDGASQGTLDRQTDLWPVSFGGGVQSGGANGMVLTWAHIYYE